LIDVAISPLLDVVFFHLRGLRCALPTSVVREMFPVSGLTPVPMAPPVLRGIAAMRGQVLPVLDLGVYFPQAGEPAHGIPADSSLGEKFLLIETTPDSNTPAIAAALAVQRQVRVGQIDEQHSRPPPPRPSFVTATVLDADGPALLINAQQAIDLARSAISTVTKP
jgi:chemotaxis signal transduction protein